MARFEKWAQGLTADDSACMAAVQSLRIRLSAIEHYLPLAADHADEDVEYVHRLRVNTRRSMTALKLYADLLPKAETKWLTKMLRKIRRATGCARDLDVLAQNHAMDKGKGAREFLRHIRQRRRAAQKPIVAIHRKMKRNQRLSHQIEMLLETTDKRNDSPWGRWARLRLGRIVQRFFEASPSDPCDMATLHRFRIRGKELRYAMELLAPAFRKELREECYPFIAQLQQKLGDINDHAAASDQFTQWSADASSKTLAVHVKKLRKHEQQKLKCKLAEFASWWTPEFEAELRVAFEELMDEQLRRGSPSCLPNGEGCHDL